jgi:hypothetical protein
MVHPKVEKSSEKMRGDFVAVAEIKITPRKQKSETIQGISQRRCPDVIRRTGRWLQADP